MLSSLGMFPEQVKLYCEKFDFQVDQNVTNDKALKGHVFYQTKVKNAVECDKLCRDNCSCLSINYKDRGAYGDCELNESDQTLSPGDLVRKRDSQYYDLRRRYEIEGKVHDPLTDPCTSICCQSNQCPVHTRCKELCHQKAKRFMCVCQPGRPKSDCHDLPRSGADLDLIKSMKIKLAKNGRHLVYDDQEKPYPVFCDFTSEPSFAWTLIESFSLANNAIFKGLDFLDDNQVNENSLQLDKYRMSLPHMKTVANTSTHVRATCNFPTDGLVSMDYFRATTQNLDIFAFPWGCVEYEKINIRGIECHDCTAGTFQKQDRHLHVNSYASKGAGCEFDGRVNQVVMRMREHNFGRY